jgi:hypothetical protein
VRIITVGKGRPFVCPECKVINRRIDLGRNLYVYAIPRGHKVVRQPELSNRIVCLYPEKPVIWQVEFEDR